MKKKILISTGGSGGHVIPAITIYDHLKNEYDILISTDLRGLKYLPFDAYETVIVDTPKFNNFILLPFAILIGGATATGKTRLAFEIQEKIPSIILNADSMQVYEDLQTLTNMPDKKDIIKHST